MLAVAGRLAVVVAAPAGLVAVFAAPVVAAPGRVVEEAAGLVVDVAAAPAVVRRAVELVVPAAVRLATGFASDVPLAAAAGAAVVEVVGVGEDRGSDGALGCDIASASDMIAADRGSYGDTNTPAKRM